ncbi:MAG: alpha/beta hydrolase domain-containing protein [Acidimicrobiales bacterium]
MTASMRFRTAWCLCVLLALLVACSEAQDDTADAAPTVTTEPSPPGPVRVTGPVRGGAPQATAAGPDLATAGYVEEEYFFSGEAARYDQDDPAGDGRWEVTVAGTAPFTSRLLVRRPVDPAAFSGVVLVEVFNVATGPDAAVSWGYSAEEILREGHAWVGVSAQSTGVSGPTGLVRTDPERYGTLEHPGYEYGFDILSAAARAVQDPTGPAPLGRLRPTTLLAAGFSQASAFLTDYLNTVHPPAGVFDGFLVHAPVGASTGPVRTDLDEPTMIFVTETELTVYGYAGTRQPDTDSVRTWEVAGAAHVDTHIVPGDLAGSCGGAINAGPHHQVLKAALHHLVGWAQDGTPPPEAPRIEVGEDPDTTGVAIRRDEHGNALGGVRTPPVAVPVAALSGDPIPGSPGAYCSSFGSTTPFDETTLAELYPTHQAFVERYRASLETAVASGFILPPEADAMLADAALSTVGI